MIIELLRKIFHPSRNVFASFLRLVFLFMAVVYTTLYLFLSHRDAMKKAGFTRFVPLFKFYFKILAYKISYSHFALNFLSISDPMSVPWRQTSDGDLQNHFGIRSIGLDYQNIKDWPHLGFLLFCGALKRSGMLDEVEKLCQILVTNSSPQLVGLAYWQLADIYHLFYRWQLQLKDPIEAGVFASPYDLFGEKYKGRNYYSDEAWDKMAEDHYILALKSLPTNSWIRLQLGHLYKDMGQYERALEVYRLSAITKNHVIPHIYVARMRFFLDQDLDQYMESMQHLPVRIGQKNAQMRLCSLTTMADDVFSSRSHKVWDGEVHNFSYHIVYKGERQTIQKTIAFNSTYVGTFNHLRNISLSFSMVDDAYLLKDTNHLPVESYKMFAPRLIECDGENACVALNTPNETNKEDPSFYCHEPVLMLGGSSGNHYYHFLFEGLASLAAIENDNFHPDRKIVFLDEPQPYHRELLSLVGATNDILVETPSMRFVRTVYTDAMQLPCVSNMTVPHPHAINFLRRKLAMPELQVKAGKRVHLTRLSSRGIHSEQQREFLELLQGAGFEIVDPGRMTIDEQRRFFADVEILSAEGGAACGNLIFCPAETRAIIIAPSSHIFEIWTVIASTLGQKVWMCAEDPAADFPQPYYLWNSLELSVNTQSYLRCVEEILKEIET